MLDHLKATKRNVADRYVLGELSPAQREEFEEHYFECVECAEDVRAFLAISSNSRSVLVDVPDYEEPAAGRGWTRIGLVPGASLLAPAGDLRNGPGVGDARFDVLPRPINRLLCGAS